MSKILDIFKKIGIKIKDFFVWLGRLYTNKTIGANFILNLSKSILKYDEEVRKGNFKSNADNIQTFELLNKNILFNQRKPISLL